MDIFSWFSIGFILLVLFFLFKAVVQVSQGYCYTVERFGRYTQTLKPGLHFIMPIVEKVGARINMMENVLEVPSQDVITRDNARVHVDGVVFYQILDAAKAAYEVNDLERATINLTLTNIRTVMGSMDLDDLLSHRERINSQLMTIVDEATTPWGVKVTRIEIRDITPPEDLVTAMARQMKAEREKRANILEAEGLRQSQILKAEGYKQSAVLEAQGKKEAAFLEAEARERAAEAEAKATLVVSEAISKGDVQAVNYFVAQKYVESLQAMASSSSTKTLFLPLEATGLISSISGIAELAKDAFSGEGRTKRSKKSES